MVNSWLRCLLHVLRFRVIESNKRTPNIVNTLLLVVMPVREWRILCLISRPYRGWMPIICRCLLNGGFEINVLTLTKLLRHYGGIECRLFQNHSRRFHQMNLFR